MDQESLVGTLAFYIPPFLRYAGGIARQMRRFNISLQNKASTNAYSDALTLADLSIQELLVAALRDGDPLFRACRLDAEEQTGDLFRFSDKSDYTIAVDPIDGTKKYRDTTADGYSVILTLRTKTTVLYSVVYLPETGNDGSWLEIRGNRITCGPDDHSRTAIEALQGLPRFNAPGRKDSTLIYLLGFQGNDPAKAKILKQKGYDVVLIDDLQEQGNIYTMFTDGRVGGVLIHTPNVYDFPVLVHIARALGGDAIWVTTGEPIHFGTIWKDDRTDMLRLPGIVACAVDRNVLNRLCEISRTWDPARYAGEQC